MRYIRMLVLVTAALLLSAFLAQPADAQVSFDFSYSQLSDHGSWLVSAEYGHVWQPREYNREWNPYYDGHWVYTEMGWTWVSDYTWGAIPYHYGTWVTDSRAGWVWIPGDVWAPAWVVFRTSPDYIGWAPVPPGYSIGMSFDMGWSSSFVFVSSGHFLAPRIRASIIPAARATVFINNTTVINNIVVQNNIVVNRGPDLRFVEKATGRRIREKRIESVARVAPSGRFDRAGVAVDSERVKRGVRVAEPVPASQVLPVSHKGRKDEAKGSRKGSSRYSRDRSDAQAETRQSATRSEAVTPGRPADTTRKARSEASAAVKADQRAKAERSANAEANTRAEAGQSAKAQATARAKTDRTAKDQATAKVKADRRAKADANDKARSEKTAKAKAGAKARKQESDKDRQGTSQGTTPKSKENSPR